MELNGTTTSLVSSLGGSFQADGVAPRSGSNGWHANIDVLAATTLAQFLAALNFGTMSFPAKASLNAMLPIYVPSGSGALLGSVDCNVFRIQGGSAATAITGRIVFNAGATAFDLYVEAPGGGDIGVFPGLLCDQYHVIQVRGTIVAVGNESISVRVNGGATQTASVEISALNWSAIDFGVVGVNSVINVGASLNIHFDDIILDDANAFISDASFLAFHDVDTLITHGWLNGGSSTSPGNLRDEDDATNVHSSTNGQIEEVHLTNLTGTFPASGASIIVVYASTRDAKNAPTDLSGDYTIGFQEGATAGATTTVTVGTDTVVLRRSIHIATVKPTGGAWTASALNAASLRLISAIGTLESVYVSETWVYSEIQVKIAVEDTHPLLNELTSINADVPLTETIPLTEATSIRATVTIEDTDLLVEALALRAALNLSDTDPLVEELSIRATVALADTIPVTETLSIRVVTMLTDTLGLAEEVTSINVKVSIADEIPLLDIPLRVIYVPQGTGGGGVIIILNE